MSRKSLVPIQLPGNPANALEAAPKQYVDTRAVPVGGATNQVLAKTSATDYATAWVTPSSGGDEIFVGPSDPGTGVGYEMWFDTDAPSALGGTLPEEVYIGSIAPADPLIELWYDTASTGTSIASGIGLESAKPTAATALQGLIYYATDTKRQWLCDGTGWIIMREPWQIFTPTIGNLTLGNGALLGNSMRSNGNCKVRFRFVLGSTSAVGTTPNMTLPYTADSPTIDIDSHPAVELYDSANARRQGLLVASGTTIVSFYYTNTNTVAGQAISSGVTATVPFTWKATDRITAAFEYVMGSIYS